MASPRRSWIFVLAALLVLALTGVALAAHPKPGGHYSGAGRDCLNDTTSHKFTNCYKKSSEHFSFTVSKNGSHVDNFLGHYIVYCGAFEDSFKANGLPISSKGKFSISGHFPSKGPDGKVNGTTYITLRGQFVGNGKSASVFYRVVTHFNNTPHSQDCGSQVSGTAHTK